jgi:hypothetical protein
VVLLESTRPTRTPLPVLKRGDNDRGPDVTPEMPPLFGGIEYRDARVQESPLTSANLNDVVTILGERLPRVKASVLIRDPNKLVAASRPDDNIIARLNPQENSNTERIVIKLDETQGRWVSGRLHAVVEWRTEAGKVRRSLPTRLALAPRIADEAGLTAVVTTANGSQQLIVRCNPPIARLANETLPDAVLLLTPMNGGATPEPIPILERGAQASNSELKFNVQAIPPGEYRVRLRVDSVETVIVKRDGMRLEFDERQTVRL